RSGYGAGNRKGAEAMRQGLLTAKRVCAPGFQPSGAPPSAFASLHISQPHDAFEQEADRVANSVMANGRTRAEWSFSKMGVTTSLQRKCSCGGSAGAEGECEECKKKEKLQRRADGSGTPSLVPTVVSE